MRTGRLYAWGALGGVLLLGALSAAPAPGGFWAPEGFVARADSLIARGGLELRCADQDSIVVRLPEGSPEEAFFGSSYLRPDVRTFNASPDRGRSPFLVEGCRLAGVDPFYHRIDLPYNRLPRWRGDVHFTFAGLVATLEGGPGQTLELRHPDDARDAARGERVDVGRAGLQAAAPLLRLAEPGGPEVLAEVFFVGESPVVADRRDVGSGDAVRVNGFLAPPGRMLRLASGDWLQVVPERRGPPAAAGMAGAREAARTYLVETGERARTASFVRVRNDRVDRLYPARRLEPLLRSFGQAMDLALQGIPGSGEAGAGIGRADVRLTLDRELGDALDGEVRRWCAERAHPTRPRAASLLVMDAFSGSVRAMPSCPAEEELSPYEPLPLRTRERFLRNQNLAPHPVGSAAKPLWAAAVGSAYPNLVDLRVPAHPAGEVEQVLGCRLGAPYGDGHGSETWTGLEAFLQRSCNRYQVELASVALAAGGTGGDACRSPMAAEAFVRRCLPGGAPDGGAGVRGAGAESPRVCDALVATVLAPALDVVGGSCGDLQLVDARFAPGPVLASLTNVATYRDPSPGGPGGPGGPALGEQYRFGRYRVDVWRDVLAELRAAGDTVHEVTTALRFAGASPQAANLALNTVEQLREDWVNLLLGGENSRWSNFELAEATARLLTGRAVRGRFADRVSLPGAPEPAPSAASFPLLPEPDLHPGVRRRVLHGMELVAAPGGTAGRLEGAVAELRRRLAGAPGGTPYDLYVVAKTGTPTVEKFVSSAQQRLVERLVGEGRLRWSGGRFVLDPETEEGIRRTLGAGTLRWLRDDVLAPVERDPEAFRIRPGGAPPAHPVHLTAAGGVVARERADLRVDRQGGVLVVGLLAVPRELGREASASLDAWVGACTDAALRRRILEVPPAERLDGERSVALSVAVYLDDLPPGEGSGSAVELATRVMDELGGYVEAEVRRRAAGG